MADGWRTFLREFLSFGLKEARACAFAGSFFALLAISRHVPLGALPRYDFLLLGALALQAAMLATKLETFDELKAICVFHALGFGLEAFKVQPAIGSWSYPEDGFTKLLGVPLYAGFMHAAVASYMVQAWRLLDLELVGAPSPRTSALLAAAIYANFFTHHFIGDYRWVLAAALAWQFRRTWVLFTPDRVRCRMPLLLAFVLIGFFVFLAENVGTYLHAWRYPDQAAGWRPVHHGKFSSWTLLVVLTFVIVADLKALKRTEILQRRWWRRLAGRGMDVAAPLACPKAPPSSS
ncbi:MAG TPA: DUF817 domain-containing protein [Xanthomonadales bacterium]|nr:DUF817 domain-containing protein [Xanthomonadales bacterium]